MSFVSSLPAQQVLIKSGGAVGVVSVHASDTGYGQEVFSLAASAKAVDYGLGSEAVSREMREIDGALGEEVFSGIVHTVKDEALGEDRKQYYRECYTVFDTLVCYVHEEEPILPEDHNSQVVVVKKYREVLKGRGLL